ncbi:MAG TPA: hypothetical protein VMG10_30965 [Gemmataceae bacterium]|nr:hypothetical protein [Gemmataceae bacterium]
MICFDTQALIWGVQSTGHSGREDIVARARRYIEWLSKSKTPIMIPAPAVTEYLVAFDPDEQQRQLQVIERSFFVAAFDLPAARMAARILGRRLEMHRIESDHCVRRQQLKVDVFIVATAIVHHAERLISHDAHMGKLAEGTSLQVCEIPDLATQGELFDS